ncbi:MAG TPA: exopolysaccharide biosynthesis protein [Gammaproteobacteria bacterium]
MTGREPADLEELLDRMLDVSEERDPVSLGDLLDAVGRRSFGPLLLLAGLIILMPLVGDIPGVPTVMGLVVLLISGQLLLRRPYFWLPGWILRRSIAAEKLRKALGWLRKPARFVDRWLRPRLTKLVDGAWVYVIALVSSGLSLATPLMELVPFSANGAGAVLTAFGLALIARDGLMALIALVIAAGTSGAVIWGLAAA